MIIRVFLDNHKGFLVVIFIFIYLRCHMNRRTSIKQILIAGTLGVSSLSFFKWFQTTKQLSPDSFNPYKALIAELAETIIPRTDTPGAKDAEVELYILKMLRDCTAVKEQHNFLNGLDNLKEYTSSTYKKNFARCSKAEKIEVLKHFEDKATYSRPILNKIDGKLFGTPFFYKLKELTVQGYCTSQIGATKAFVYDYIPGPYIGCVPLTKNQHSWATK